LKLNEERGSYHLFCISSSLYRRCRFFFSIGHSRRTVNLSTLPRANYSNLWRARTPSISCPLNDVTHSYR